MPLNVLKEKILSQNVAEDAQSPCSNSPVDGFHEALNTKAKEQTLQCQLRIEERKDTDCEP